MLTVKAYSFSASSAYGFPFEFSKETLIVSVC